jgi:hypothetical protein
MVMIARAHMRQLECEIERAHLAEMARDTRPHRLPSLSALVIWLREKLPLRLPRDTQPARAGEMASTGSG